MQISLPHNAFSHLQGQIEKMECVKVFEQIDQEKYRLKNH